MADPKKIGLLVADLKKMKTALVGEDKDTIELSDEEMKSMDRYQKKKRELNISLKKIREEVDRLQDFRRKLGAETRDANVIRLQNDNTKALKQANEEWQQLKTFLAEDQKNSKTVKKLGEKELMDRHKTVQLLGQEICNLSNHNARVKDAGPSNADELSKANAAASSRSQTQRKERENRLNKRKERRGGGRVKNGAIELDDDDFRDATPASKQEQDFMDQTQANNAEQDEMLDEISKGLDELKELSLDMNKELTLQNQMIAEVGEEMEKTIDKFKSSNAKLKTILDENGGMTRWCPTIVCGILLLACVGYMFNMFD